MTRYFVLNAKGIMVGNFTNKEDAIKCLNKGLKRGWNWTIETSTWETNRPTDWEMAGYKADPTKVNWGDWDGRLN